MKFTGRMKSASGTGWIRQLRQCPRSKESWKASWMASGVVVAILDVMKLSVTSKST